MISRKTFFSFAAALLILTPLFAQDKPRVHEGLTSISVETSAPMPPELGDSTQAHALAREAAVVMAQNELLKYIEKKKTHSGRTVEEAEIISVELGESVKGLVQGAELKRTTWKDGRCTVKMSVPKSRLKPLLKKN